MSIIFILISLQFKKEIWNENSEKMTLNHSIPHCSSKVNFLQSQNKL